MRAGGCGRRGKEAALGPGYGWNIVTKAPVAHGGALKNLILMATRRENLTMSGRPARQLVGWCVCVFILYV